MNNLKAGLAVVVCAMSALAILMLTSLLTNANAEQASWYGSESGSMTASGEPFNPSGFTAASPSLPFGTRLLVSHKGSDGLKRSVTVTVNDRGPYVSGRSLDLSEGAAAAIGLKDEGAGEVEVTELDSSTSNVSQSLPKTGGIW